MLKATAMQKLAVVSDLVCAFIIHTYIYIYARPNRHECHMHVGWV